MRGLSIPLAGFTPFNPYDCKERYRELFSDPFYPKSDREAELMISKII